MFKLVRRIPVVGTMIYIINSYVYNGDSMSGDKFAPLTMWLKKLFGKFVVALLFTGLVFFNEITSLLNIKTFIDGSINAKNPGSIIISTFPSLIGFGIGVYALTLVLSESVVSDFQKSISGKKNTSGSVLMLSSDLAFPMLILVITLSVGILQGVFIDSNKLCIVTWFMLWYSFIVIIEMLGVLFGLSNNSLLDKL
ncbi:hypothetical protein V1954_18075 [Yersinia sp. 2538 StPb PI]|uniref:hypothetical protein n=1 Tax=Yersinia TaxID=629 RepID=UPI003FA45501